MKIKLNSVYVEDQDKALKFYTVVLGFVKNTECINNKFLVILKSFACINQDDVL